MARNPRRHWKIPIRRYFGRAWYCRADCRHRLQRVGSLYADARGAISDGGGYLVEHAGSALSTGDSSTGIAGGSRNRVYTRYRNCFDGVYRQGPPVLVSVKGADFARYPFYGRLELNPAGTRLGEKSVAVSDDLLLRINAKL